MKTAPKRTNETWTIQDALVGVLFLTLGVLLSVATFRMFSNLDDGGSLAAASLMALYIMGIGGILVGPLFVLIGANALVQGLWGLLRSGAAKRDGRR